MSDPSNLTVADSSTINADTLDSSELCLLQSIYMTFDNFLELSCGDGNVDSNSNTGGIDYKAELLKNAAAEEVSGDGIKEKLSTALDNMKDGFGLAGNVSCELVTDVTKSHDKLKRMDVRIKILEMLQVYAFLLYLLLLYLTIVPLFILFGLLDYLILHAVCRNKYAAH